MIIFGRYWQETKIQILLAVKNVVAKEEDFHSAPFLHKWEDETTKADEWLDFIVECLTMNLLS